MKIIYAIILALFSMCALAQAPIIIVCKGSVVEYPSSAFPKTLKNSMRILIDTQSELAKIERSDGLLYGGFEMAAHNDSRYYYLSHVSLDRGGRIINFEIDRSKGSIAGKFEFFSKTELNDKGIYWTYSGQCEKAMEPAPVF